MAEKKGAVVERSIAAPNCVTIFGGGVAGLTAAHELAERGFRVQVWEPRDDPRKSTRGAELGGMARTQWVSVPWERTLIASQITAVPDDWKQRRTRPISEFPQKFFADSSGTVQPNAIGKLGAISPEACALELFTDLMSKPHISDLYCEVLDRSVQVNGTRSPEDRRALTSAIHDWLVTALAKSPLKDVVKVGKPNDQIPYAETMTAEVVFTQPDGRSRTVLITVVNIDEFPEDIPSSLQIVIGFRVRERWLPGEHGFRFFPSFYHHVFDSMSRTPILEPVPKLPLGASQERAMTVNANPERYTESGRTVFDNLHPTTRIAIGFADGLWPAEFTRSLPRSFEELYDWLRIAFEQPENGVSRGLGFTARDVSRFQLKLLQFLTSGSKRRKLYEQVRWLDFLGGEKVFSAVFLKAIGDWPEALVAMRATEVDARTHGVILSQLVLDNLRPPAYRDGTLNGPTSEAWIKHWKRYLEAQGVEFIHGRLLEFRAVQQPDEQGGGRVMWPRVECYEPRYPDAEHDPPLLPGYFVLALPAKEARRIANTYQEAAEGAGDRHVDLAALARQRDFGTPADLRCAKPTGQLRHMIGIQYYFDEDISWLDGHAYFPGSPWGLSSISQVRFWQERHDWEHGYRGILSVVISVFDQKFEHTPPPEEQPARSFDKAAWDCTPEEMAEATWKQIKLSLGNTVPEPRYWHIDDDLILEQAPPPGRAVQYRNTSPYQINLPGCWEERPGDMNPETNSGARYSAYDGVVCAGTHMKTFTRLTTMESANESARHAVNAILGHSQANSRKSPCSVWPLEDREVTDLQLLQEIDDELCERGLDHFLEILGIDEVVTHGLRGAGQGPLGAAFILGQLRSLLKLGA